LAEYWNDILELADHEQRQRLRALVTGTAESDPLDVRAALGDMLLDVLPPDHPMVEVLRTGTMFDPGNHGNAAADVAESLARLARRVFPEPSRAKPLDEFDHEVRGRLLDLPAFSPDELRERAIDPDDHRLIRLPHPDRGPQLPAFQFTEDRTPWPVVQAVNEQLDAAADPWGVTCWWVDPHAGLDAAPAELLGQGQDELLSRAAAALGAA
jgi:hypothetical protein